MKFCLVVAATLALASGLTTNKPGKECHCGVFIATSDGEQEIHRLHAYDLDSCDDEQLCDRDCSKEWLENTNDGDLNGRLPNGKILGNELCKGAFAHDNTPVHHAIPMVYS